MSPWLMNVYMDGMTKEVKMGVRFLEEGRKWKVNAGKSKVVVLNREEGLEREANVDRVRVDHVSEFKCLGCVLHESGKNNAECR